MRRLVKHLWLPAILLLLLLMLLLLMRLLLLLLLMTVRLGRLLTCGKQSYRSCIGQCHDLHEEGSALVQQFARETVSGGSEAPSKQELTSAHH